MMFIMLPKGVTRVFSCRCPRPSKGFAVSSKASAHSMPFGLFTAAAAYYQPLIDLISK